MNITLQRSNSTPLLLNPRTNISPIFMRNHLDYSKKS